MAKQYALNENVFPSNLFAEVFLVSHVRIEPNQLIGVPTNQGQGPCMDKGEGEEMRGRQCSLIVALAVSISLCGGLVTASRAGDAEIPVLRGLKEVSVHVEDLDFRVERVGLTTDHIKTNAESKLKRAGMKVLSEKVSRRASGSPQLHIIVKVLGTSSGDYAAHIRLELREAVALVRHPSMEVFSSTWTTGTFGVTPTLADVRVQEQALLDKFITEYRVANPKY